MCVLPRPLRRPRGDNPLCWDGQIWAPPADDSFVQSSSHSLLGPGAMRTNFAIGRRHRDEFKEALAELGTIKGALEQIGLSDTTYRKWCRKYPNFKAEVDLIRGNLRTDGNTSYLDGFTPFRRQYLGQETTWFQQRAVTALEECKEGEIILLLWPPEHGKTTLIEDFCNYKLGLNPQCRITVVSEKRSHSVKVLRRVRNRMEPDGPARGYVNRFGPFVPPEAGAGRATPQPWAADHFDVRLRGSYDERDYSMVATGITTGIQGTRSDWMLIDDIQSLKSLNQTTQYVDLLRQDFFSRPGMFGRICLLGTRVGNNDVYEVLIEEGLIDNLIVFPAVNGAGEWLWPERYSADQYARMRKRVGEQAWFRNYMQKPSSARDTTFTPESIDECCNPTRSVIADCPREYDDKAKPKITSVAVSLDPALGGGNAIMAGGFHSKQLMYLSSRVDWALTRNEQIFDLLEQTIIRWNQPNVSRVTELIIEQNNFQKGLLDDDRMRELKRRYGLRVVPHTTGFNKMDPNIGIPSMALSFIRGEIDLPFADKPSQDEIALLKTELLAWKPYARGNRLRQDRVVTLWFQWIRWRSQRPMQMTDPEQFRSTGSPLRRSA